jgi:hypothetical protein
MVSKTNFTGGRGILRVCKMLTIDTYMMAVLRKRLNGTVVVEALRLVRSLHAAFLGL